MVEKIIKTKTEKGKKLYYVKYDGYDDKFNEWFYNWIKAVAYGLESREYFLK